MPGLKDSRHRVKKKKPNQQTQSTQNTLEIQDPMQLSLKFVGFFPTKHTAIFSYFVLLQISNRYWF